MPTLDDRTYEDLVREGLKLVGSGDAEWTNHNASDPGITLLEVLAYATELLIYRTNQLTAADILAFARLLAPAVGSGSSSDPAVGLTRAVLASRRRERLVTCADYEAAATSVNPGRIGRAHCVADRDLTAGTAAARQADRPGHVTVLLVPRHSDDDMRAICDEVAQELVPRALLTTRVHVGAPEAVGIGVRLLVGLVAGAPVSASMAGVSAALADWLHPATGGPDGRGWPLGRWVYVSEVYRLVDRLPGVDYVSRMHDRSTGLALDELVVDDPGALVRAPATGELVAVRVEPHQVARPLAEGHILQAVRDDGGPVSPGVED